MNKYFLKKRTKNLRELHDNINTYNYYLNSFEGLAISNFKYENMPTEIDVRYVEQKLYYNGSICFAYDDILEQYICLPCTFTELDIYGNPLKLEVYGLNGYQRTFTNHVDAVLIYNNVLKTNSVDIVRFFASKLQEVDRTIDTNIFLQKTPMLVRTNENKLLSINNLIQQYENNVDYIKIDENSGFNQDTFGVFKTGVEFIAPDLYELKIKLYNECLTYLGISNVSYQKKERLISDEVAREQGGIIANRNTRLSTRERAIDEINKLFGLNIKVLYNEMIDNNLDTKPQESEVDEIE